MAYASIAQVQARNTARPTYSATTHPTASQVSEYLDEAAALIDNALSNAGYVAPVDPTGVSTSGVLLLSAWNSIGAAYLVEAGSQASDRRSDFKAMWDECLAAIANGNLPFPLQTAKALPRDDRPEPAPQFTTTMQL